MNGQNSLILNIGMKLKSYRVQKGQSIKKLSELSGVSDQTIMNLENGKANNLSILTLLKLSQAISIPIIFFLVDKNMTIEDTSLAANTINSLITNGLLKLTVKDKVPVLEFSDKYLYNYYKYTIELNK